MDEREWEFAIADECVECGAELPIKVCRSAAGAYIGKECPNDGPYSRLSEYNTWNVMEVALVEWQDIERRGGSLMFAPWVRKIGYQPGPMVKVDFPEPRQSGN